MAVLACLSPEAQSHPGPLQHQLFAHLEGLYTPHRDRQRTLSDLRGYCGHWAAMLLNLQSGELEKLGRVGAERPAIDPPAQCKSKIILDLYKRLQPALNGKRCTSRLEHDPQILLANIAHAFRLDQGKLCSVDPYLRSAERARLMQGLVEQTDLAFATSRTLAAAWRRYELAMQSLMGPSLVRASGRDGAQLNALPGRQRAVARY